MNPDVYFRPGPPAQAAPRWRLYCLLLATLAAASPAGAHELGTIRTHATFRKNGTYRIEVVIDREHLPPGFPSGAVVHPSPPIAGLDAALIGTPAGRILAEVASRCEVRFDGRLSGPELEWVAPDAAAAELVLRLSGPIPGGAREFTWRNTSRLGTYLLTLSTEGEEASSRQWLEGGEESRPFGLKREVVPPTWREVVHQYLTLGYSHILPKGADHILFVLGIFLLTRRWKPVLLQITAFTVAHTITLGLTIYGVVALRPAVVEPLIALSIVYVAVENLFTSSLTPWRVALVFGFGLIHGMGFAGVLRELGLPRSQFLPALISFNVGVELGQLTVIFVAYLLLALPFGGRPWYQRRVAVPFSLAIAAVGLFWAVQRAFSSSF